MNHSLILIPGMHRSGTSLITRLVNLLGFDLGQRLMPASADNPRGYWENMDVVEAHEALLASLDSPWTSLTPLPDDWQSRPVSQLVRQRLQDIVTHEFADQPAAIKDPRLCRFLPLWHDIAANTGRQLMVIMAIRHPVDVARSLEKRDAMSLNTGLLLWLRHVCEAERDSRDMPRIVVDYDVLLKDWRQPVRDIAAKLGIDWPVSVDKAAPAIRDFIAPDLRHHYSQNNTVPDGPVAALAMQVYHALCADIIDQPVIERALNQIDTWTRDPLGLVDALGSAVWRALETERKLIALQAVEQDLRNAVGNRDQTLIGRDEHHRQQIHAYHEDREKLLVEITRLQQVESDLHDIIHDRDRAIAGQQDLLSQKDQIIGQADRQIVALSEQVSGLLRSTSWRITAPMRWVRHSINHLRSRMRLMVSLEKLPLVPDPDRVGQPRGRLTVMASLGITRQVIPGGLIRLVVERDASAAVHGIKPVLPAVSLSVFVDYPGDHTHHHRLVLDAGQKRSHLELPVEILPSRLELAIDDARDDVVEDDLAVPVLQFRLRRIGGLWRLPRRFAAPVLSIIINPRPAWQTFLRGLGMLRRGDFSSFRTALARRLRRGVQHIANLDYQDWISLYDTIDDHDRVAIVRRVAMLPWRPRFSVLMPVYNPPIDVLRAAIDSVREQIYPDWELCIVDDASPDPDIAALLVEMAATDHRIKYRVRSENGHISRTTNDCLALATGDFAAMMDHDDVLRPHALSMMAEAICQAPDAVLLYSDEDKIDEHGRRYDPYFKCAWNYDLFLSQGYLNHLTVIKLVAIRDAGGWRVGFEGSQDHDLLLRIIETIRPEQIIHVPAILYHWRAIATSTASGMGAKNTAAEAGERAIAEHLQRIGSDGRVGPGLGNYQLGAWYRVRYPVPQPAPLVSLIIPTRDKLDLLRGCVDGLLRRTDYPALEIIIVDNNSEKQETLDYLERLADDPRVRVIRDTRPFNYSALNNNAVAVAKGSIIGLINNDIEVIHPDWLTEMVGQVMRPQIGCVGAMLYYADDRIQHAGVICGLGGVAGHSHKFFPRQHPGYFGRLGLVQQLSAVTAACLLVRKSVYEQVGGLDEIAFTVAFNDVDFCLKVRDAGYINLWTPYAELYHLESASRGQEDSPEKIARFQSEMRMMKTRWAAILADDPAYSPNLTQDFENFGFAFPPRLRKPWLEDETPVIIRRS